MCIPSDDKFNFKEYISKAKKLEKEELQKITAKDTNKIVQNTNNFHFKKSNPFDLVERKVDDRFFILELLNTGTMGFIYLARDILADEVVALKVVFKEEVSNNDISRFIQEANIASSIQHQNIITVYGIEETKDFFYIFMEYIDGLTLDEYVSKNGVFSVKDALDIIKKTAQGLAAVHKAGLVHRDIKPSNLMFSNKEVKIMDFGIVKDLKTATGLTSLGTIVGTPQFMAPELITKSFIDARTDIYSLGATLYYLLTGKFCFVGNAVRVMQQVMQKQIIPPEQHNPKVPSVISKFIYRMMAKQPEDRPQTVDQVIGYIDYYIKNSS